MAQGKQALKSRIRSIQSTKKITNAMELIATTKLQKQKKLMENNREYATYLAETVGQILADNANVDNKYLVASEDTRPLYILFTSDMGLCGGYNSNELKYLSEVVTNKENPIVVIGTKGLPWLKAKGFNVENEHIAGDGLSYNELTKLITGILDRYVSKDITSIRIVYTKFVNSVSFVPEVKKLLPVTKEDIKANTEKTGPYVETEFEPNPDAILNDLIPMYVKSLFYSYYLETKTSEQASRRMAMENATDNAEELIETLTLKFNQARQAAITQEITEIVGGADAL